VPVASSALTPLVGQQERHPARKKMGAGGGGGHLLVRMEWRPARWLVCLPLLIFPCTIKSRSSLLAPADPGGVGKRAIKWLWCGVVCAIVYHGLHVSASPMLMSAGFVNDKWQFSTPYFLVLDLVSSVLCQEIGWEERLRGDLFCVKWDNKTLTKSVLDQNE